MKKMWYLILLVFLFIGTNAHAELISGVTIESVSSEFTEFGWNLTAAHLVDGSGLADGKHAQNNADNMNSWQTRTTDSKANVVFDLGDIFDLDYIHIWNLNFYTPYNGRGAKDVQILLSENSSFWTPLGTFQFEIASGVDNDLGFTIDALNWEAARYVQFNILDNFRGADNAGHVGLSEVQFYRSTDGPSPVPEPSTMILLGIGLAGTALAGRRMRRA
jgi:hypothetical protein